jgi:hypothetical protein
MISFWLPAAVAFRLAHFDHPILFVVVIDKNHVFSMLECLAVFSTKDSSI